MVRAQDQASAVAPEEVLQGFYLVPRCFLLSNHVVQTKYHERVGIREDTFVDRQAPSGLIDPLINSHGLSRDLTDQVLEIHQRQVKQLKCASNPLEKHFLRVLDRLVIGPPYAPDLGHGGEAVI